METFEKGGIQYGVGPNGEVQRLDEFCLAIRAPETGIFCKATDNILFADGSSLNKSGHGGSRPPSPNQFESPGKLERLIFLYWRERFERSNKAFRNLKWNIKQNSNRGAAPDHEDVAELKKLKKIAESTAKEMQKAELAWQKTQYGHHEETDNDRKHNAARAEHNSKMSAEANAIELNV